MNPANPAHQIARPSRRSPSPVTVQSLSTGWFRRLALGVLGGLLTLLASVPARAESLTLRFKAPHWLYIEGDHLPGRSIEVNYLEAYCRAGSTDADWVKHTVIPHRAELLSLSADRKVLKLRDTLEDGVVVEHTVTAGTDSVDFRLVARNPRSRACVWATSPGSRPRAPTSTTTCPNASSS
jgi:hypothetical protein